MTNSFDFDLFVIGAGSGGVRTARVAASQGKRVAIAEVSDLGGTCVNVGCVPKKLFVYASQFPEIFHASEGYGWNHTNQATFNWNTLRDNKSNEIARLNAIYQKLLNDSGATIIQGRAKIEAPQRISINGQQYSAKRILIATGGWPHIPDIPGKELAVSSNEIFSLAELPKRAVIVGGGYIAVEFAGILNGLGVETHLIYRGNQLLKSFDRDCCAKVTEGMIKKGVKVTLDTNVSSITKCQQQLNINLDSGSSITVDMVLYATGRQANTEGLGLENTKVTLNDRKAIMVDENYCTSEPSIYAIGDVIDRVQLTPVAIKQAMALINHLYQDSKTKVDYTNIPTAVFSQPELATVGLTELQAKQQYTDIAVYRSDFKPMFDTLGQGSDRIFMKMIVNKTNDRVIGCHMVGHHAAEIIQGVAIAIKAGATKSHFDSTIGIHPSTAEEFVMLK
ncbi:MAG: glutathione-disulfide reductase [Cellvibrionales bacterium TMED47]|nr:glutathione-disulfide reductase [Porticoccaceae bacterium]RPG85225.1 MAG: glutathione-disulfide reductase [Cellvibrionales bacterium TMED47]